MADNKGWYVLQVLAGTEAKVARRVAERTGEQPLVPMQELHERHKGAWETRQRVIFPGYVFLRSDMSAQTYYIIRAIAGVIRFLGDGRPAKVPEEQMEIVKTLGNSRQPFACSIVEHKAGETRVLSGPLQQLEDRIVKVDTRARRAVIAFQLLGEEKKIPLGICSPSALAGDSSPQESDGEQTQPH